jgi:glyceraldehyde 3-phosphate dehydrogenase
MPVRVAINGFGRVGRAALRASLEREADVEWVAINDLAGAETLAYLLARDSLYGRFAGAIRATDGGIEVDGEEIPVFTDADPAALPWADLGVDVVIESTGKFRTRDTAAAHLEAGARKVIMSAPPKDAVPTFVLGVNFDAYDPASHDVISNASCTTNCLAPVAKVLHETVGIRHGQMTTVHAYTADQRLVDLPHKDLRRARAAALSIIPTTTGAAKAVGEVMPALKGKIDGISMRVPTPNVSVVDLNALVEKKTTAEEVNATLKEVSDGALKGIMQFVTDQLVSIDFRGNPHSSIIDASYTKVMDGDFVKVMAWYDNEWGYSNRCVDLLKKL